ncbi:MAG: pepsin/retropepsin-like aspartic protease family protein, partial [Terriglobales bacterium]
GQTSSKLPAELERMKAATGGQKWDAITLIAGEGEKTSFGLTGKFHIVEEPGTGFFEARANYGLFGNGEGFDRLGRWRQDNSGGIHPLDSDEANEVAVSESYLAGRAYFFPERVPATFRSLDAIAEGSRRFCRMVATPAHGRAITLWIDLSTNLLDRAVMGVSIGTKTLRYGDYRLVESIMLPFHIAVENSDENETGLATIRAYRISTVAVTQELTRPVTPTSDVAMAGNIKTSIAKAYLDATTGFFIVEASIDGKGPYPFILDTGGHNILTPQMVRELGLTTAGKGFSTGAGEGTTATEFTKVQKVAIGSASLSEQPFTVLHIDLGMAHDGNRQVPAAGILGLELFERFAITLDIKGKSVTLAPLAEFNHSGAADPIPIRFTSDMPLTRARLDDHAGWFGLDTGNNVGLIVFRAWAESNGLAAGYSTGRKMDSTSVGGSLELRPAKAKSFQLGGRELGPLNILLAPENGGTLSARSEAGNFGCALLSHFRVTFDYRAEAMYLDAPAAAH